MAYSQLNMTIELKYRLTLIESSFFTFCGVFLEVAALWAYRKDTHSAAPGHEKYGAGGTREPLDAPAETTATAGTTAGTTAPAGTV